MTNVRVSCRLWLTKFICATFITVKIINGCDFTEHSSVFHGHGSQPALPTNAQHQKSVMINVHVSRRLRLAKFICATFIIVKIINGCDFTEHSSVFHGHGSQSMLPYKALRHLHRLVWVHFVTSVALVYISLACFAHFTVLCISTLYMPHG